MQPLSGPGLVLRRTRHMEQDLRLVVLMKDQGKFLVLSKGGLKFEARLKSLQELFTEADFHLSATPHGVHARLLGGKLTRSSHGLAASLDAFTVASRCAEVADAALPFRAPSPDVFDILQQSFYALSQGANPTYHWIDFCLKILRSLGYGDLSADLARLVPVSEQATIDSAVSEGIFQAGPAMSESSLNRCRAFLESRLDYILPRPLKSGVLIDS